MGEEKGRVGNRLWLAAFNEVIPAGEAGLRRLKEVPDEVPSRASGARTAAHRERHCLVRMLRVLATSQPSLFPMRVERLAAGASPDFLLTEASGRVFAVEHTDSGTKAYQRFLSEEHDDAHLDWSPGGNGWGGNARLVRLLDDVLAAVERKSEARVWRDAPPNAERVLLTYCQVPIVCMLDADELPKALSQRRHVKRGPWAPSCLVVIHAGRLDLLRWNHGAWGLDRLSSDDQDP